jgi:hypothetical protein
MEASSCRPDALRGRIAGLRLAQLVLGDLLQDRRLP